MTPHHLRLGSQSSKNRPRPGAATILPALALLLTTAMAIGQEAPTLEGKPLPQYAPPSGGLVADIKKRGVIVNGMEAQNPPFEYIEGGKIVGYDADLMQKLGEKLGVTVENMDTAWAGVIPSLYARKFDLIWSAMTI